MSRQVKLTLTIDLAPFNQAMRELKAVIDRASGALSRLSWMRDLQLQHGAGNRTGDGEWQSDLCAAWLHQSCPLPGHCDCGCH